MVRVARWWIGVVAGVMLLPAVSWGLPTATDMEAAHGAVAVAIKDAILKAVASAPSRGAFAARIIPEFSPVLASANADARLNTAIVFGELKALVCDATLGRC